jgi:hypothetical protein
MLCDDEKSYQAYMDYLDAMERQGKAADPEQAVNAVLDSLQAADLAKAANRDAPENDKTLSPFFCSPVDQARPNGLKMKTARRADKPNSKLL